MKASLVVNRRSMFRLADIAVMAASALISGVLLSQSLASAAPREGVWTATVKQRGHGLTRGERTHCLAQGGRVGMAGPSGDEMCALPFRDAGRACTDRSQCAGLCLAPEPPAQGKPAASTVGHCQAFNYPYGCHETVDHGQVSGALCTD
jgi:hypothetical protein